MLRESLTFLGLGCLVILEEVAEEEVKAKMARWVAVEHNSQLPEVDLMWVDLELGEKSLDHQGLRLMTTLQYLVVHLIC